MLEKQIKLSKSDGWLDVKELLKKEIEKICDYDKVSSLEEFLAYRNVRKIFKEIVRKIDGAEDTATFYPNQPESQKNKPFKRP